MHIADGILSGPVIAATACVAAGGVAVGLRRMDFERVPRVGVMASVFFVASLVHVSVGVSSAHLVLTGLMGVLLGWAAFPALAAALLLQAVLFGFGGVTSLGANVLNMSLPAVGCYYLFGRALRARGSSPSVFAVGFAAGCAGIALSCLMVSVTLLAAGREFLGVIGALLVAHIPVMLVEGFVTGAAVAFLRKVRPELLVLPLGDSRGGEL